MKASRRHAVLAMAAGAAVTALAFPALAQDGASATMDGIRSKGQFACGVSTEVKSVKDLNGATICVPPGTSTELAVPDYVRLNELTFMPILIQNLQELRTTSMPPHGRIELGCVAPQLAGDGRSGPACHCLESGDTSVQNTKNGRDE